MFKGVAVIVFSFLIRVQFPKSKSIAEIIRSRYIKTILKKFGNWRNLISVYAKQSKISNFLCKCDNDNVDPKIFNFCAANNHLKHSSIYN